MSYLKSILFLTVFCFTSLVQAQTVGTLLNTADSWQGYTLLNPLGDTNTYLINNCGEQINQWSFNYFANSHAELDVNGDLYRSGIIENPYIDAGGAGGIIERFDWNNNLLWQYELSDSSFRLHHDFEILPNGNILAIAWERQDSLASVLAGRDPDFLLENEIWIDKIIEIQPVGTDEGIIVWEWNAWDHLIQDFDESKENYGIISESPRKLNINAGGTYPDWMHCNSLDYNAERDEIILGCPEMHEFYIIDHSTTTAEASTSFGGAQGFGGDFIYRWGNPATYDQGEEIDQLLFYQHSVNWIEPGLDDAGKIILYNNRLFDGPDGYSTVNIIDPDTNALGEYFLTDHVFGPTSSEWTYSLPFDLWSNILSSAQRLPNGNTLICSGRHGRLIEIDQEENVVWSYKLPITYDGLITQGELDPSRFLFNTIRYSQDFVGFIGEDLTPGDKIELEPIDNCELYGNPASLAEDSNGKINLYPNPTAGMVAIEANGTFNYQIVTMNGDQIVNGSANNKTIIDLTRFAKGVYLVNIQTESELKSLKLVVSN